MAKTRIANTELLKISYDAESGETKLYICACYEDLATNMPAYKSNYIEVTTLSAAQDTDLASVIATALAEADSGEGV